MIYIHGEGVSKDRAIFRYIATLFVGMILFLIVMYFLIEPIVYGLYWLVKVTQ